ncbi:hypothetical protein PsyrH_25610 [Pseudomonas syringae pv. syringae HS191]|nr:hypothetical protein PsyrH_25610 [Pseudomonas syringae pv. syringae HS191]
MLWDLEHICKGYPPIQPNRILRYKPPNLRVIIPKRVVMQSRLDIKILPLKPQVLLNLVHHQLLNRPQARYFACQTICPSASVISSGVPIWSVWK